MKRLAFTLTEIIVAIVVMGIIVGLTLPITRDKLDKVDYVSYYLGYKITEGISAEVMPTINSLIDSGASVSDYAARLREEIVKVFSIASSSSATSVSSVQSAATSKDFSSLTPHVTFANGAKLYIGSAISTIAQLSDSTDEKDRSGYVLYIDVDGKQHKTKLYSDVFPYYLTRSGKVIPAFDSSVVAGANNNEHLAFNIIADIFDASGNRTEKILAAGVSFREAACLSKLVTSSTYCGTFAATTSVNGVNCTLAEPDCRIKVKKPIRILN